MDAPVRHREGGFADRLGQRRVEPNRKSLLNHSVDTAMMDRAACSLTVACAKAPNAFEDGDDRPTLVHDRRLGIVHWAACDVARHRVAKHDQERGSRIGGMVTLTTRPS
jgi:YD repeat-containing protein